MTALSKWEAPVPTAIIRTVRDDIREGELNNKNVMILEKQGELKYGGLQC